MNIALIGQYVAAIIVALSLIALFLKGEQRRHLNNVLLGAVTVFVVIFLSAAFSPSGRMSKGNSAVGAEMAEMQLRLFSCFESVEKSTAHSLPSAWKKSRQESGSEELKRQQRDTSFETAEKSLEAGLTEQIKSDKGKTSADTQELRAKLATVLLKHDETKYKDRIQVLAADLEKPNTSDPNSADVPALKPYSEIGQIFRTIIEGEKVSANDLTSYKAAIAQTLPKGWYQTEMLLRLYDAAGAVEAKKDLEQTAQEQNLTVFFKFAVCFAIAAGSAVVGLINILAQIWLYYSNRDRPQTTAPAGLDLPWRSIYAVFVSWFAYYVILSMSVHHLLKFYPGLTEHPLLIAVTTGVTYLLGSLAGPFFIYYFALKPQGLPFWSSLRLTVQPSEPPTSSGEFDSEYTPQATPRLLPRLLSLMFYGYLGWCSIFPVVIGAALFANKFLGAHGSDNPVLKQITQVAASPDLPTVIVFYLTLGVMAPFFEELMFRGFLYSALKNKIGIVGAMIVSAALFAGIHFDKGGVLMLFAIGMMLAATFERSRSLVPSIIAHGLWNSGSFTITLILFSGS